MLPCADTFSPQVRVIDVFAMPQSGTGVSVEAVDPVFQTKMLDMLKQTGRPEMGMHLQLSLVCSLPGCPPPTLPCRSSLLPLQSSAGITPILVSDAGSLVSISTLSRASSS
jgi:hypothetical protein